MSQEYPCPCCGYLIYDEPPGTYFICPICFWEDDLVQLVFPDGGGGANRESLIEAQQNFAKFGACSEDCRSVRPPTSSERRDASWRPLDPQHDRYLHDDSEADHQLWRSVMDKGFRGDICLYYWRYDYWMLTSAA
jgi:hypothetical protein